MFIDWPPTEREAVHNLINLHLYPEFVLRLGQPERYQFREADIVLERTGNLYSSGKDALTYRYNIDAPGFSLCLLATWNDPDQATADVYVAAITPDSDEAREAAYEWLNSVVNARMPPRDLFANMRLD